MKDFNGKALFLDRSDINTDEIIPAKYLTEISKEALKPHLLEDLVLDGFRRESDLRGRSVVITRSNFGCGSSREHAPWALEVNNINLVIAVSFARIFRQNMFNCGMIAAELPADDIERLFRDFSPGDTEIKTDLENSAFTAKSGKSLHIFNFNLSEYDRNLIDAGGWVDLADRKY